MNKADQKFIMGTALLEVSIAEQIDGDDLKIKESSKVPGKWAIVQKSTGKIFFVKDFNRKNANQDNNL